MHISAGGNIAVILLLALAAAGLAVLFYRFTLPPLPGRWRYVLSALRALALIGLVMMLFEPILRLVHSDDLKPVIAVLVDNSESMTISDAGRVRSSGVGSLLSSGKFRDLSPDAIVRYYLFSSKLGPPLASAPDSLHPSGPSTDLSEVFAELRQQAPKDNIRAAVLVTDGNYTTGRNPLYAAGELGMPVYTVGVGDTSEQKDILVEKVLTNNLAYAGTRFPMDVTVKSTGFSGENVEVDLLEGSAVIDRKVLQLVEGSHEYEVKLFAEPKDEGTKKYTIAVSKLPGELTERNNTRTLFIKVLRSRLRIVIFAGAPSADVAAVRQALTEDQRLNVKAFVQNAAAGFYEGNPNASLLDSADCFVLIGFPSAATPGGIVREIAVRCETGKKPLLFLNGLSTDYPKLRALESDLPFTWSGPSRNEMMVFAAVPDRQKHHPLVRLEGEITEESWRELPPVYKTQTTFHARAEAEVLAAVKYQTFTLDEPAVLTRDIARQKTVAVTVHGIWRWRLLAQDKPETRQFLPLFLTNAVRWLTTQEDDKRVRITPVKETFTTAEPAELTAQVYDDQLRPADDATVKVELDRSGEKFPVEFSAVGNGRYEGSISGLAEGDYTFTGKASSETGTYGEDKGKFSVGQVNVEFLETRMNKPLLEQIADRTGGAYADAAEVAQIGEHFRAGPKLSSKVIIQTSEIELWNWRYVAAVLILLFAIEWFLRKRNGML